MRQYDNISFQINKFVHKKCCLGKLLFTLKHKIQILEIIRTKERPKG